MANSILAENTDNRADFDSDYAPALGSNGNDAKQVVSQMCITLFRPAFLSALIFAIAQLWLFLSAVLTVKCTYENHSQRSSIATRKFRNADPNCLEYCV